jgi:hypothetical protein
MLWVWVASDNFHIAADADRWGIAFFILLGSAINFLQLSEIHFRTKLIFNCRQIRPVGVALARSSPLKLL